MNAKLSLTACAAVLAVGLAGCAAPAKFTGGGYLPSTSGGAKDKANMTFNLSNCEPTNDEADLLGRFNYHDRKAPVYESLGGVKMHGWVVRGGLCTVNPFITETAVAACDVFNLAQTGVPVGFCPPDSGLVGVDVEYESTNPKILGGGTAIACARDGGEGAQATSLDAARVYVLDGPYAGYGNQGVFKGNIQRHGCTCKDGIDNDSDGLVDQDDPSCNLVRGANGDEY